MLRMNIDQTSSQLFHDIQGDRRVIYKSTRFTRGEQFPAKDTDLGIILQVIRMEKFFQLIFGDIEGRFDHTFIGAILYTLSIRTLTEHQR